MDINRKMATIRQISAIYDIPNADNIVLAQVDGWKVIVKKNEYKVDDLCVYCEIDSFIPTTIAPFLTREGYSPSEYNNIAGEKLRTVRLRGQISQGLILPPSILQKHITQYEIGDDVSEELNITKYEPLPSGHKFFSLVNNPRSKFPEYVPKTDQERIQNCHNIFINQYKDDMFEGTLKVDGTSCTVLMNNEDNIEVCNRNSSLKDIEGNKYWETARKENIVAFVTWCNKERNLQVAVQSEIMGPNIQKNRESFKEHMFYIFDIFDIKTQSYLSKNKRLDLIEKFNLHQITGKELKHVPIVYPFAAILSYPLEKILELSQITSINNTIAEGIVWKCIDNPNISFKVINNLFLLKE